MGMNYEIKKKKKKQLRESMNLNNCAAAVVDAERKLHSIINFIRA